jgi:hypothetical protein
MKLSLFWLLARRSRHVAGASGSFDPYSILTAFDSAFECHRDVWRDELQTLHREEKDAELLSGFRA